MAASPCVNLTKVAWPARCQRSRRGLILRLVASSAEARSNGADCNAACSSGFQVSLSVPVRLSGCGLPGLQHGGPRAPPVSISILDQLTERDWRLGLAPSPETSAPSSRGSWKAGRRACAVRVRHVLTLLALNIGELVTAEAMTIKGLPRS